MDSSEASRINELLQKANRLPHGPIKFSLVEEAARLADETRDLDRMFAAHLRLMQAGSFSGHAERSLTLFAWCLSHFENDPQRFRAYKHSLLWHFKSVFHHSEDFPQMSREQFDGVFEQMTTVYRHGGYGMRPVYYCRFIVAMHGGDRGAVTEWAQRFQSEPRDAMADCLACEAESLVEYYELMGDMEKAIEMAQPSLNGQRRCAEVPHQTLNNVLRPLSLLGRYEEAEKYQRLGYQLIRGNPEFLRHISLQMAFLVHRGRPAAAVNMLERHLGWALNTFEMGKRHSFYLTAIRVLKTIAEKKVTRKLVLPQEFPAYQPSNEYDLMTLVQWFQAECDGLAARFDRRNGNDFYGREIVQQLGY